MTPDGEAPDGEAPDGEAAGATEDREAMAADLRRRRRRIRLATVAVLVVLVGLGVVLTQLTAGTGPAPLPKAPRFTLARLGGGPAISYPADGFAGRANVLVFFASWCVACQRELPMVAEVVRQLDRQHTPVRFLGVDGNDTAAGGLAFARHAKVPFASTQDPQEEVANQLGLPGLPDTVFVSARGKVVHIVVGAVKQATLRHWVQLLAATPGG